MTDALTDVMLTTDEVCRYFKTTRHTLWRMRRAGIIQEVYKVGNGRHAGLRFSLKELKEAFLLSDREMWKISKAEMKAAKEREKNVHV